MLQAPAPEVLRFTDATSNAAGCESLLVAPGSWADTVAASMVVTRASVHRMRDLPAYSMVRQSLVRA
jgi:hypothetical protein